MNKWQWDFIYALGLFPLCLGIFFLYYAFAHGASAYELKTNSISVDAYISKMNKYYDDGETYYNVYVTYNYNGQKYEKMLNEYSSSMSKGDKITILINPQNPTQIVPTKHIYDLSLFLFLFGFIFASSGVSFFIKELKYYKKK